MNVSFNDFTDSRAVYDYLINHSKKKVVKVESRISNNCGVVLEHSDSFLSSCSDIKYYFEDTEILEINRVNKLALFIRGNGESLIVDSAVDPDFEETFIYLTNRELGLDFHLKMN